eukprot:29141_1
MSADNNALIAYCETIQLELKQQYPHAYEVWNKEPQATLSFLKGKGIIEAHKLNREYDMEFKQGNDRIEAWKEYKVAIEHYLTLVNDDVRLKKARETLAHEIWVKHYKRFPCWPAWPFNTKNEDVVELDKKDKYVYNNKWFIVWSVGGSITITDHRPYATVYKAKFNGKPTLRVLKVNNKKFNDFNQLWFNYLCFKC